MPAVMAKARAAHEPDRHPQRQQGVWRFTASAQAAARRPKQGPGAGGHRLLGGVEPDLADHSCRRGVCHHGLVGLGQIDPGAPPQPADRAQRGRDRGRRPEHPELQPAPVAPVPALQGQHGVSGVWPAAAPHGARQRGLWPVAARRAASQRPGQRPALDRPGGPGRPGAALPRRAVRWHEATRGPGARAGGGHPHRADGRGLQRAGPADPRRDARPVAAVAGQPAQDHRLHHPRPGRGAAAGPAHRPAQGRRTGAAGHPARPVAAPGQRPCAALCGAARRAGAGS